MFMFRAFEANITHRNAPELGRVMVKTPSVDWFNPKAHISQLQNNELNLGMFFPSSNILQFNQWKRSEWQDRSVVFHNRCALPIQLQRTWRNFLERTVGPFCTEALCHCEDSTISYQNIESFRQQDQMPQSKVTFMLTKAAGSEWVMP